MPCPDLTRPAPLPPPLQKKRPPGTLYLTVKWLKAVFYCRPQPASCFLKTPPGRNLASLPHPAGNFHGCHHILRPDFKGHVDHGVFAVTACGSSCKQAFFGDVIQIQSRQRGRQSHDPAQGNYPLNFVTRIILLYQLGKGTECNFFTMQELMASSSVVKPL